MPRWNSCGTRTIDDLPRFLRAGETRPGRGRVECARNNYRDTGELIDPAVLTEELTEAAEWDSSDVELVTYDRRLAAAANDAGMTVIAPADSLGG